MHFKSSLVWCIMIEQEHRTLFTIESFEVNHKSMLNFCNLVFSVSILCVICLESLWHPPTTVKTKIIISILCPSVVWAAAPEQWILQVWGLALEQEPERAPSAWQWSTCRARLVVAAASPRWSWRVVGVALAVGQQSPWAFAWVRWPWSPARAAWGQARWRTGLGVLQSLWAHRA